MISRRALRQGLLAVAVTIAAGCSGSQATAAPEASPSAAATSPPASIGDGTLPPAPTFAPTPVPTPTVPEGYTMELPPPRLHSDVSLEAALAGRRSVRDFTAKRLTLEELSQLLWAAQGLTSRQGGRTAPSAGALYPLETYVVTPDHVLHYLPSHHRAKVHMTGDRRRALQSVALDQTAVGKAAAVIVITGVFSRTEAKYGARAERYVWLEAGHAAQNVLLEAVAMGLGGVPIGAFGDAAVRRVLKLPGDHEPLYLIPIGHPA